MIAVDVMGGDYAPDEILLGALNAAKKSIPVFLVGSEDLIKKKLSVWDADWEKCPLKICHASQQITMSDEPVLGVRQKRDSSIVKIMELVKTKQADVALSAGNSGAMMVAACLILGKYDNIERPAIAGLLPTAGNERVLALDLGANTECKPKYLYQFAQLGRKYAVETLGIADPKIALLANGEEASKGSALTKEAFGLLKNSSLNFIGNIEPSDIYRGKTDIVICDGFSGNILLKTMEASVECFSEIIKHECVQHKTLVAQVESMAMNLVRKNGGALLLGIKGNVVICHGNSNAQVIENAIQNCFKFFQ